MWPHTGAAHSLPPAPSLHLLRGKGSEKAQLFLGHFWNSLCPAWHHSPVTGQAQSAVCSEMCELAAH